MSTKGTRSFCQKLVWQKNSGGSFNQYPVPEGMFEKQIGRTDSLTSESSAYMRVVKNFNIKSLKYCFY